MDDQRVFRCIVVRVFMKFNRPFAESLISFRASLLCRSKREFQLWDAARFNAETFSLSALTASSRMRCSNGRSRSKSSLYR